VKLLLDTHALIWWAAASRKLARSVRERIDDPANEVLISSAAIWELEIKAQTGKLLAPDDAADMIAEWGFVALEISPEHARLAAHLPEHHRDPFDRMLVAQTYLEDAVLVTADRTLGRYGVATLRADG